MFLILKKKYKQYKNILYKKLTKNKFICNIFALYINKVPDNLSDKPQKLSDKSQKTAKNTKPVLYVSKQVIELRERLLEGIKIDRNFEVFEGGKKASDNSEEDLYIKFLEFIKSNTGNDNRIPKTSEIETGLNLTERKRKDFLKRAEDEKIIIKVGSRIYKLCPAN